MKNLKNLLIIFGLAATIMSCSDKDEPTPQLKDVEFGLFTENKTMDVAQSMMASENEYSREAGSLMTTINPASYGAFFTVPEGATKVDAAITATNARTNANVVTYKWVTQQGTIAYQVTEKSDSYYYEIFMQYESGSGFVKWIEGEQAKDRRSGYLVVLDALESERTEMIRYQFEVRNDNSLFIEYISEFYNLEALFNQDKSGYIKLLTEDREITGEYTWDGKGNGSWTQYDEETGAEIKSVTWSH